MLNERGKVFVSHTKIDEVYVIRMVIGQTYVEKKHIQNAVNEIDECCTLVQQESELK